MVTLSTAVSDTECGPVEKCNQIVASVPASLEALWAAKDEDKYEKLFFDAFEDVLNECPRQPRTTLKRQEFEHKYGNMHRSILWSRVVKQFHNATGDPLSKTDFFLDTMAVIDKMWRAHLQKQHCHD